MNGAAPIQTELPFRTATRDRRIVAGGGRFRFTATFTPDGGALEVEGWRRLLVGAPVPCSWFVRVRLGPEPELGLPGGNGYDLMLHEDVAEACSEGAAIGEENAGEEDDDDGDHDEAADDEAHIDDEEPGHPRPGSDHYDALHALRSIALECLAEAASEEEWPLLSVRIERLVKTFRNHLFDCADPHALSAVRRFHPSIAQSFALYRLLVSDGTGRLAQLATTCPGLLLMIRAFERFRHPEKARALVRSIVAGKKLGAILDEAVTAWMACAGTEHGGRDLKARQRIWIRRASAGVSPRLLWMGPPPVLVPEDVPTGPDENAAFYRLHCDATRAFHEVDRRLPPDAFRRLCRFYAKNAVALEARGGLLYHDHPDDLLRALAAYAAEAGRRIGPKTSVETVEAELGAAMMRRLRRSLRAELEHLEQGGGGAPFPPPPPALAAPFHEGDVTVRPLDRPAAILRESVEMDHCLHLHVEEAAGGAVFFFRATVAGRRLTVRVDHPYDGVLRLGEVAGPNNRPPDEEDHEAIRRWFEAAALES